MASSIPAGVDLCAFPAGTPPPGQVSNFDNPPSLAPVLVGVTTVMTALAILFTAGRLYANFRKLKWSDYLVLVGLVFSLATTGLMLSQLKTARHQWDVRACWYLGGYTKVLFAQEIISNMVLFFSKASILVLLYQIFSVEEFMRVAITIGLVVNALLYWTTIPIAAYFNAPSPGGDWDDVLFNGRPQRSLWWGITQALLSILLDLYIFILPLPVVFKMNLSVKKRAQILAVFFMAVIGVVASVLSLVYRVEALNTDDGTWKYSALLICGVVESNVAIIISSGPGFSSFARVHLAELPLLKTLRSTLIGQSSDDSYAARFKEKNDPNKPRTGRGDESPRKKKQPYYQIDDDTWALKSHDVVEMVGGVDSTSTLPAVPERARTADEVV